MAVDCDELDCDAIESQIASRKQSMAFTGRFCEDCQNLLDHWPLRAQESAVRSFDTIELEAAARHGCVFCAFLLTRLKSIGHLSLMRKLEMRLKRVGKDGVCSLMLT